MSPDSALSLPPQVFWVLASAAFVFGCCVGSYLNVVIYRIPLGLSTGEPRRSFCPLCKYSIPFYHNIPVISWILLRARCANCKAPISGRYPFVELLTGLLFLAVFARCGYDLKTFAAFVFVSLCVAGSYIDIDHKILPHRITWGGAAAGLAASVLVPDYFVEHTWWMNLLHSLGGAALGYGLIWVIIQLGKKAFGKLKLNFEKPVDWSISQPAAGPGQEHEPEIVFTVDGEKEVWSEIFCRASDRLIIRADKADVDGRIFAECVITLAEASLTVTPASGEAPTVLSLEDVKGLSGTCSAVEQPREAMGLGDANWMACVGAFLGWKAVLFSIFAGSLIGAAISLLAILLGRREWAATIPFGPYLAAGALIYLFRGPEILEWYFHFSAGDPGLELYREME